MFSLALLAAAASSILPTASATLAPIVRKGPYLFDSSSGDRFFIKGAAYPANYGSSQTQPDGSISKLDPLANTDGCKRDVSYFQELGINLIRVYQANSSLDHSECMSALDSAGIYVLLDLATPSDNGAISSSSPSWNTGLMTSFLSTVDAFGAYTNVLGFNVGNEVITATTDIQAAPYVKAALRDVKSYISTHGFTQLVGYTATDTPNSRIAFPYYLACDDSLGGSGYFDYWGLNIYEWCGESDFVTSGYQARTAELAALGIPAFFSEYGCNSVEPRTFEDVPVLYSSNMTDVWSGGIVFEFINESNDFGLGNVSSDGSSYTPSTDFTNYQSALSSAASAIPTYSPLASYTPTVTAPTSCPTTNDTWTASNTLPPTPNGDLCDCVVSQLSCVYNPSVISSVAEVGTAIGVVCGISSNCTSVSGNGTTGVYGDFSMCDPTQVLDIALDAYYESQSRSADACDFSSSASLKTASTQS
ncbi:uncharacterized protein STEHIDRAFT_82112, partial [Stereum hirsutum FP-91666 SS1]|uniref:uncharacterized protein n=1 Tax=Stereum hirsutum (strain FP-91666) TaxID=721885 RepID=UPI0004449913